MCRRACVCVCACKRGGGVHGRECKWLTDQLLHWSTDWLGWKAERVKKQHADECTSGWWISMKHTAQTFLLAEEPTSRTSLTPHNHSHIWISTNQIASKAVSSRLLTPCPLFMLCELAASSKAIQQNGKLNFIQNQSMRTEAYHFNPWKSIEVHSSGLVPETRSDLAVATGACGRQTEFTQMAHFRSSVPQTSWFIATEVKVHKSAAGLSLCWSGSLTAFPSLKAMNDSFWRKDAVTLPITRTSPSFLIRTVICEELSIAALSGA